MQKKSLFYTGLVLLILFEAANVYFIMPMPGSQEMNSLPVAYFLYQWRWFFRGLALVLIAAGFTDALRHSAWKTLAGLLAAAGAAFLFNMEMAADHMFYQPGKLMLVDSAHNKINLDKLVIGVEKDGIAKAYPIQLIGYHHQVRDTLGNAPVMVTYCTVCRTGRVFMPVVYGQPASFRLVGMDHFNAMFEDAGTGSWWRQATGEAVAGSLTGERLPEIPGAQTTLRQWLEMYPHSLIMQADSTFSEEYNHMDSYDFGIDRGELTRTDTLSWQEKSWVAGIDINGVSKAFDWNDLKRARVINDAVGAIPVVLVMADDSKSFFAFERPDKNTLFEVRKDTLWNNGNAWDMKGNALSPTTLQPLKKIPAYQEFWHSWRTFHPNSLVAKDTRLIGY